MSSCVAAAAALDLLPASMGTAVPPQTGLVSGSFGLTREDFKLLADSDSDTEVEGEPSVSALAFAKHAQFDRGNKHCVTTSEKSHASHPVWYAQSVGSASMSQGEGREMVDVLCAMNGYRRVMGPAYSRSRRQRGLEWAVGCALHGAVQQLRFNLPGRVSRNGRCIARYTSSFRRVKGPAYSISKRQRGLVWAAGSAESSSTLHRASAVYRKACEVGTCKPRAT